MPLASGTRLGPYEIVSPLGAGGMGEVYRARDTRLEREVAVKVLPQHLAATPEVRSRFEREAKTISSLNHAHICTLFDVGHEGDTDYLVMELVDGETLAARLERGPLPMPELLRLGMQIADALDRAHKAGIVHRDLKPGNVMLTKAGAKLMDFGLARVTGLPGSGAGSSSSVTIAGLTQSPTVAQPLTSAGSIVGTFQYMAPEQLEGKETDARGDIWALGCVLYEMATGKRAFDGKSQALLISSIMVSQPAPLATSVVGIPPALDRVIQHCLAKDPDDRTQSAHDVKLHLQWIAEGKEEPATVGASASGGREKAAWGLFAAATLAAGFLAFLHFNAPEPVVNTLRFEIPPPSSVQFQDAPRISPDGKYLAYNATDSTGAVLIWVRPMNALTAQAIGGTEGAQRPFWSPDSRFLGFMAGGKLKKIPVTGGPVSVICDAPTGADGAWSTNGTILYDGRSTDPIMRVSAAGGVPAAVVTADSTREVAQVGWPEFLPDGRHFFYLEIGPKQTLMIGDLDSDKRIEIGPCESQIQYVPPGYILYSRSGSLVVQPFDAKKLKLTGEPIPVAEQVTSSAIGASDFRASMNGTLCFSARRAQGGVLVQFDRSGRKVAQIPTPANILLPTISPDETKIALRVVDDQTRSRDIWLVEPARGISSRLTVANTTENYPIFSPDGRKVLYYSDATGSSGLHTKELTGAGREEKVLDADTEFIPDDWSLDGRFVLYERQGTTSRTDIWVLPMEGERKPFVFLDGPFDEYQAHFSPDGRYVVYGSDESGRPEIYVQTFPDRSAKWRVSTEGGEDPVWSADGREIFYLSLSQDMISAPVRLEPSFEPGVPVRLFASPVLFPLGPRNHYVVTKDAGTFYVIAPQTAASLPSTTVIVNWMDEIAGR